MRIGSLFSGAGGLDMAVEQVFGGEVAWHCEVDTAASKVLAHRWPGVPNLGSITEVDWTAVEPVDVLCGGFPCQDVSSAGRRAGLGEGTRTGLWARFADAIAILRPRYVVAENVRGLLSATAHRPMESEPDALGDPDAQPLLRAIGAVLGDLSDLGYDAQWATVAAASVGAPHRRERVFILATDANADSGRLGGDGLRDELGGTNPRRWPTPTAGRGGDAGNTTADAASLVGSAVTPCDDSAALDRTRSRAGHRDCAGNSAAGVRVVGRGAGGEQAHANPNGRRLQVSAQRDGDTAQSELSASQRRDAGGRGDDAVDLLPTPAAARSGRNQSPSPGAAIRPSLDMIGDLLQTPSTADGDGSRKARGGDRSNEPLLPGQAVEMAQSWGKYAPAITRWEQRTRPAPPPTEPNTKGNPRLNPAFSEWLMGWPEGWVTDAPGISRNDALRIVGNGVCVQQGIAAFTWLLSISAAA